MLDYEVKNKKTTLILCIFLGFIGAHHFYNNKVGKGMLYLFTYGIFLIGWIYDIIKIINQIKEFDKQKFKKYCSKCGTGMNEFDSFCSNCGHKFDSLIYNTPTITTSIEIKSNYNERISIYRKNKSRKLVNDYIVFDLETTGLDCNQNKIIEIGALKYKNNELIDKFNILINPQEKLSKKITDITGITDDMLKDCDTIHDVLPKFINWIEDFTLIAHNGSFDLGFIEAKIKELNLEMIQNKNIDTLYLSRKWINDTENHKLETLKKHFKLDYNSHRALEDCYVTNYIYQYCKNKQEQAK